MSVIDDCKSIIATWENHPELMEHNQNEYDLRKLLIEYDQALREAQEAMITHKNIHAHGDPWVKELSDWLDKYSHLLKGE